MLPVSGREKTVLDFPFHRTNRRWMRRTPDQASRPARHRIPTVSDHLFRSACSDPLVVAEPGFGPPKCLPCVMRVQ
jgi:hypothetical protein